MALANVHIDAQKGDVKYLNFKYLYISPNRELRIDKSMNYAGVLIDGKNIDFVKLILKRIRGNSNPLIYLKPIILVNGSSHHDPFVRNLMDGVIFSFDQIPLVHDAACEINERIDKLQLTQTISFEAMVVSKLLNYMYSRGLKVLEPIPYVLSNTKYSFPFLACNYELFEEHEVLNVLKMAEAEGVFKSKYIDRIYLCSNCKSGHLSYRETCPKCSSSNTDTFDIVHHFPCAYVGPISDFENNIDDQLFCPKCSKKLKHIGVDYDKPSVLHVCKNCDNRFQDYQVKAKCMSCTYDNQVEALISETISEYQLTKKGENFALQGYVSTPKDIEDIIGTVKYDTLKMVVRYEVERLRQTDGSSNLVAITIDNVGEFYSKVGIDGQKKLLKDLVAEIRSSIRSSDMISFYSSSVIIVTMFDIPMRISQNMMREIELALEKLIEVNFNRKIDLKTKVHQLNYSLSSELQISQLITE
ncbi:MAG TPA: hypothetical protein PLI97_08100 [Fluviicola sp.]|nr:hypothetical protein [Fluviicola sp.]